MRVRVGQREAAEDGRDALLDQRGDDREGAAGADEQRPVPERLLEGVERQLDRPRVGRDEAVASYIDNVLRFVPEAKVEVLTGPVTEEIPAVVE